MEFSLFLSCYFPDTSQSAARMYGQMLEMAQAAERLGFCGVTVPEHHMMNILMNPNPLTLAVKVASVTRDIPITTAVVVLPLHDMRRLAAEIALADVLTEGRIRIGAGRGAFSYEFIRYGVPFDESREIFDESLEVLEALLSEKDVSWDGKYYRFEPLTIMPRPLQQPYPPICIAAMAPESLYHCARRGFDVQTTPLTGTLNLAGEQIGSFFKGAAESDRNPRPRLSLLRVGFCTRDDAHTEEILGLAESYWRRFDNVFKSDGSVHGGAIDLIDATESREALADRLFVGTPEQLIEKFRVYADLGVHEINLNMCLGASHEDLMDSIGRLAGDVMPHFSKPVQTLAPGAVASAP